MKNKQMTWEEREDQEIYGWVELMRAEEQKAIYESVYGRGRGGFQW